MRDYIRIALGNVLFLAWLALAVAAMVADSNTLETRAAAQAAAFTDGE